MMSQSPLCVAVRQDHEDAWCCCRRIAKATGAQLVLTLADMDGQETFEASALGTADEVLHSNRLVSHPQLLILPLPDKVQV